MSCFVFFFFAAQHIFDAVAVKWFVLFLSSRGTTGFIGKPLLPLLSNAGVISMDFTISGGSGASSSWSVLLTIRGVAPSSDTPKLHCNVWLL